MSKNKAYAANLAQYLGCKYHNISHDDLLNLRDRALTMLEEGLILPLSEKLAENAEFVLSVVEMD